MNYYTKYLKYKNKYLQLRNILHRQHGGDKAIINDDELAKINLFKEYYLKVDLSNYTSKQKKEIKKNLKDLDDFLNPIYGLVLSGNGFIKNTYNLHNVGFTSNISNLCTGLFDLINDEIRLKTFLNQITLYEFGQYIGLLYIYKRLCTNYINDNFQFKNDILPNFKKLAEQIKCLNYKKGKSSTNLTQEENNMLKDLQEQNKQERSYLECLQKKIDKIKNINEKKLFNLKIQDMIYNPLVFHLIIYCMWWQSDNYTGITEYYRGINDIFSIINDFIAVKNRDLFDKNYFLITQTEINVNNINLSSFANVTSSGVNLRNKSEVQRILAEKNNKSKLYGFEALIYKVTNPKFKIIDWGRRITNSFCRNRSDKYSDCGETAVRNLINLCCFDETNGNFSLNILSKLTNIKPIILEYYTIYNNFNKQISGEYEFQGLQLNARDAWSYIIINNGANVKFGQSCVENGDKTFDFSSGLSIDNENTNIFQLMQNLLGITNWSDIPNLKINENFDKNIGDYWPDCPQQIKKVWPKCPENFINKNGKTGIGAITINHKTFGNFILICNGMHYSFEYENKKNNEKEINTRDLDLQQIGIINIIQNEENIVVDADNFIYLNLAVNNIYKIVDKINKTTNQNFKKKLIVLLASSTYINDNNFNKILIDVDDEIELLNFLLSKSLYQIFNRVHFICSDFNFLTMFDNKHNIENFTCSIKDKTRIVSVDIKNVKSFSDNFMTECENLQTINFHGCTPSQIGTNFMSGCSNLIRINNLNFINVKEFKNGFLENCKIIKTIDFNGCEPNKIGMYFMSECCNLESINNLNFINVKEFKYGFLANCTSIRTIDFNRCTPNKIEDYFMYNCLNLEAINNLNFENIGTFENGFLQNCESIKTIDFKRCMPTKIKDGFMNDCIRLEKIDNLFLHQVEEFGDNFLDRCLEIQDFSFNGCEPNKIGKYFMADCGKINVIDGLNLRNIKEINEGFLGGCKSISTINFYNCEPVVIGNYFMTECTSLKKIDNLYFQDVKNIGDSFLANCNSFIGFEPEMICNELTNIGNDFMFNCSSIQKFIIENLLTSINRDNPFLTVGDNFLANCISLNNISGQPFTQNQKFNKIRFGKNLLSGCSSLSCDFKNYFKTYFSWSSEGFFENCNENPIPKQVSTAQSYSDDEW